MIEPETAHKRRKAGVATDSAARDPHDFNVTQPHAVEALLSVVPFRSAGSPFDIWEPACGDGAISRVFEARGHRVVSTDLVDRGFGESGVDFLAERYLRAKAIVTNPPFGIADAWIEKCIDLHPMRFALLLPVRYLSGQRRGRLFARRPPEWVLPFSARHQTRRAGYGGKDNGTMDLAWFVWGALDQPDPPKIKWL